MRCRIIIDGSLYLQYGESLYQHWMGFCYSACVKTGTTLTKKIATTTKIEQIILNQLSRSRSSCK
jgi:hypothetical protein